MPLKEAIPWLRQLVAPRSVHVGSVVDTVALGQVLRVLQFSRQDHSTVAPHSYTIREMNNRLIGGHSSETISLHQHKQ
jgi:hypothetical protein